MDQETVLGSSIGTRDRNYAERECIFSAFGVTLIIQIDVFYKINLNILLGKKDKVVNLVNATEYDIKKAIFEGGPVVAQMVNFKKYFYFLYPNFFKNINSK